MLETDQIYLKIQGEEQELSFYYSLDGGQYHKVVCGVNAKILSTEIAGGFVGCTMGMYTTSNHQSSDNIAEFEWLELV